MFLFDAVKLSEFIQLSHERLYHLHALEQFLAALIVALVLFTLNCVLLILKVGDLVAQCI